MTEQKMFTKTPEAAPEAPANVTAAPVPAPPSSQRKSLRIVAAVAVVVVALIVWRAFFAGPRIPPGIVVLSGRIEGDDSAVAPKTTGRILEVRVREGDVVNQGDTIAILDDDQVRAREDQARDVLIASQGKLKSTQEEIAVLQEQLHQNQLQTDQSKMDAAGRVRQADSDLAAAEADLAQQQASYQIALFDKDAYTKLAKTGAVSERQGLQAVATADQQAAAVAAAKRRVDAAQGALTMARANLENPNIRESQVSLVRRQIEQQQTEIASAIGSTAQARAQVAEAEANRQDLIVKAPFAGTIVTRAAEPGEVVTAGTAIVTMLDLTKVYLRGFVPEGQIGKVKLGQTAHVYLDSNPKQAVDAYVSRIDPEATFTPENTYFRDDRVKQVVGLKLQLKGAFGFAKPGMPADGEILVQGNVWPKATRSE